MSCGAILFASARAGARATTTFDVRAMVDASCIVTAGPANLAPTYSPLAGTGTGAATTLNTVCIGTNPTVTFTDAAASGTSAFTMGGSGSHALFFQLSNKTSCDGSAADDPISEGAPQNLSDGLGTYDICAAVTTDGTNGSAIAGAYSDTVTYTVSS